MERIESIRKRLEEKPLAGDPARQRDYIESLIRIYVRNINDELRVLAALRALKRELVEKSVETVE